MASVAVLVNGLPGSGKSALATQLGALLGCPVLAKDVLKESFAELLGPRADGSALGSLAMDTAWSLAAQIEGGVVIDSFWMTGRDTFTMQRWLETAGAPRAVEVWCDVPPELARQRFEARIASGERHGVHTTWDEGWDASRPVGLAPVIRLDTATLVDLDALVLELGAAFL